MRFSITGHSLFLCKFIQGYEQDRAQENIWTEMKAVYSPKMLVPPTRQATLYHNPVKSNTNPVLKFQQNTGWDSDVHHLQLLQRVQQWMKICAAWALLAVRTITINLQADILSSCNERLANYIPPWVSESSFQHLFWSSFWGYNSLLSLATRLCAFYWDWFSICPRSILSLPPHYPP